MLNDSEIQEFFSEQEINNTGRNAAYDMLERSFWDSEFTYSLDAAIGTENRRSSGYKRLVNLVKARVKDKINISSQLPEVKVLVPPEGGEDGEFQAELTQYAIYGYWEHSNMQWLFRRFAYFSSLFGTVPIVALPHFEHKKMLITTRHPKSVYADSAGDMIHNYSQVGFVNEMTGRQLLASYPELAKYEIANNSTKYKFVEYFDKNRRLFFVEGAPNQPQGKKLWVRVPKLGVEHNLGFIPVRVNANTAVRDGVDGLSDVIHELGLEENFNDVLGLFTESVRENMDALLVISGEPDAVPKQIPNGRGAFINVGQDARVSYERKAGAPMEVHAHLGYLNQIFRDVTGWAGVRSGVSPASSIVTGKAVSNLAAGTTDDANAYRESIGNDISIIDEYCTKIEKKLFPKVKQEIATFINDDQKLAYYYPEDLPDYFKHKLIYNPLGFEASDIRVGVLQLVGQGIIDKRTARELLPGINPDEVERREEAEQQKQMEIQNQMLQMQAAAQQQANAEPMPVQQPPGAPAFGGMPPQGELPMIPEELIA